MLSIGVVGDTINRSSCMPNASINTIMSTLDTTFIHSKSERCSERLLSRALACGELPDASDSEKGDYNLARMSQNLDSCWYRGILLCVQMYIGVLQTIRFSPRDDKHQVSRFWRCFSSHKRAQCLSSSMSCWQYGISALSLQQEESACLTVWSYRDTLDVGTQRHNGSKTRRRVRSVSADLLMLTS